MSMTDPISDMLTRIRNGLQAGKSSVKSPASKARQRILDVLQREGYIRGYERIELDNNKVELSIELTESMDVSTFIAASKSCSVEIIAGSQRSSLLSLPLHKSR